MAPAPAKGRPKSVLVCVIACALVVHPLWSVWMTAQKTAPEGVAKQTKAKTTTPTTTTMVAGNARKAPPPAKKSKTIAYAISVTKDGSYVDGAAVLAHSAIRVHRGKKSKYGVALVAFVAPSVTSVAQLEVCGYRVLVKELPVEVKDIQGQYLRDRIATNGCCGAWELLKLYSWTLLEYHRVVHVDMDVAILQNIDELYDDPALWGSDVSALFTYDWTMARGHRKPVQGGFVVARPSLDIYDALVDVVRQGDFRAGTGWGGSGHGGYWGGMTIQGLLPYFFEVVRPNTGRALDECVYNQMANNPRDQGGFDKGRCRRDGSLHPAPCRDCRLVPASTVKTVHFTICQKPWSCVSASNTRCPYCPLCAKLHKLWFDIRKEMELEWGTYSPTVYTGRALQRHGMCGHGGPNAYIPVPIDRLLQNRSLAQAWRDSWGAPPPSVVVSETRRRRRRRRRR